jgi:dTDP-glucose pyrophosphorylase
VGYRVVIPTAGIGSRLGGLTKYINKSLVSIANRPTISHVIEQFPDDCEFVIALGHKGKLVQDFLELTYPDKVFYFENVIPFEGPGSGLGLSLIACKKYLQEPFVFISCDTLVKGVIKKPDHNWMGFTKLDNHSQYRTISIDKNIVAEICEKGIVKKNNYAYIGLAGIYNYKLFWDKMLTNNPDVIEQGESYGMRFLIEDSKVLPYEFQWFDTGNTSTLTKTREAYIEPHSPNILEKENEAIWFIGNSVVKYSDDKSFISNRVKRANELKGFVPEIYSFRENMYCYKKIDAKVLSDVVTIPIFDKLMKFSETFWTRKILDKNQEREFRKNCSKFYKDKTNERIKLFYKNFNKFDNTLPINGEKMPLLDDILNSIDWDSLSRGLAGRFHGDFHFENILWSAKENKFTFLDWRQDFAGDIEIGDIYYDLAKLLHGIIVNHGVIASERYNATWEDNQINYQFDRKKILVECEYKFAKFILSMGYDLKKVRVLTALIYLNIAALHHYPYSVLLYGLGKKMLKNEMEVDYGINSKN